MRRQIKRLLRRFKVPEDHREATIQTLIEQGERIFRDWPNAA
jgi:hypothetical protein